MQNKAFEKYVWGATFFFCALMMSTEAAHAATVNDILQQTQNPFIWGTGLVITYLGTKLFGSTGGQF